jgi:hypothetical protein
MIDVLKVSIGDVINSNGYSVVTGFTIEMGDAPNIETEPHRDFVAKKYLHDFQFERYTLYEVQQIISKLIDEHCEQHLDTHKIWDE